MLGAAAVLHTLLPMQVASTGLPYHLCARPGPPGGPHRTWDNAGRVEDVATGSAAGRFHAYLT